MTIRETTFREKTIRGK